ncbi:hypothetical protein CKO28_03025 [Rhodovibrio sodomensis]|uniref:Uncharacterized protein n=1 Tax=Rhodovibrio sodomensis TaxID=1088 RepID=A0ABS1DAR1_9PROT|nr:hypothetical protein [Rhodovibrio sodomensis]MBK1667016.1 hypothetical protein [Rhodovibrio sodomensis]
MIMNVIRNDSTGTEMEIRDHLHGDALAYTVRADAQTDARCPIELIEHDQKGEVDRVYLSRKAALAVAAALGRGMQSPVLIDNFKPQDLQLELVEANTLVAIHDLGDQAHVDLYNDTDELRGVATALKLAASAVNLPVKAAS